MMVDPKMPPKDVIAEAITTDDLPALPEEDSTGDSSSERQLSETAEKSSDSPDESAPGLETNVLRNRAPLKSESAPRLRKSTAKLASPTTKAAPSHGATQARCKTMLALIYLYICAPLLILWALIAWVRHRIFGQSFKATVSKKPRKVLITGGKMSKASAVARALGRCGHKVFTAEILPYRFCHTRFVSYVSKHYVLPRPTEDPEGWEATIQAIVKEQGIDLIIPCTAPIESSAYAHLRERLPANVQVFAFDGETSDELDNKYTFNQVLVKAGLHRPETANMECVQDAVKFFKQKEASGDDGKRYIVKPAVYDPKARTEILFLPIEDKDRQLEYLKSRNASKAVPYVIQEVLENPEYGTFAIYNKGQLTGFEFFQSAASCLVYRTARGKHYDAALELHRGLGKAMNLTGQLTLDLMHTSSGDLVPIECNPRIHSAVCTLEGHECLGPAYAEEDFVPSGEASVVTSSPDTFKYWIMDQLFLMAGFWKPKNCFKLTVADMARGTDALLNGDDPIAFLAMYLVQIPSLLVLELLAGTPWLKIDFCIGKIVKEGGD
jgi:hypothetical protein